MAIGSAPEASVRYLHPVPCRVVQPGNMELRGFHDPGIVAELVLEEPAAKVEGDPQGLPGGCEGPWP